MPVIQLHVGDESSDTDSDVEDGVDAASPLS